MHTAENKTVTLHLSPGTRFDALIVGRTKDLLMKEGIQVRVLGEDERGNVARERIVVVLPGGTQVHGVGDLRTRVKEAFEQERRRDAAIAEQMGAGSKRQLTPRLATV